MTAALVAGKASFLGLPAALAWADLRTFLRSLAAISYMDVGFAAGLWATGRVVLALVGPGAKRARLVSAAFVTTTTLCCLYATANLIMFGAFGGFFTYPLLTLVGNVRMLGSSAAAYFTPGVAVALAGVPLSHLALVGLSLWLRAPGSGNARRAVACVWISAAAWMLFGQHTFATDWSTRQERRVADNAHWVLVSSLWHAALGPGTVSMDGWFPAEDLEDFEPLGRVSNAPVPARPPNVILLVLESVGARWTSLHGDLYDSTPSLEAAAARGLVFDNFYAHTGRSSNSLAALLLSSYPRLGFRDLTEEYPDRAGTSLAQVFRDRGYRTVFATASDLAWAGWDRFLGGRGFQDLRDHRHLGCAEPLSSWGVEDRCLVEALIQLATEDAARPFFFMGWTQQTHHPYESAPSVPLLEFPGEPVPDGYNLSRYLTVLHETDRHLGRLFDALVRARLDSNTLVVVTGDHGQAFGYPHQSYMQGRTVYEEDVRVPLLLWFPSRYRQAARSASVGGQIDLAPTIAELAGVPAAPDWLGRSLLGVDPRRAYFYVADDEFRLGVREGAWKYIYNLREGTEELYDLDADPLEQDNLAALHPTESARLRQRLVAWTEANRRQYSRP